MEDKKEILPIGSVVMLKFGKKKVMITGYSQIDLEKKDKMYDYCGCLYPEGMMDDTKLLFNREDIKEIYFEGYRDEYQKVFATNITFFIDNINKDLLIKRMKEEKK